MFKLSMPMKDIFLFLQRNHKLHRSNKNIMLQQNPDTRENPPIVPDFEEASQTIEQPNALTFLACHGLRTLHLFGAVRPALLNWHVGVTSRIPRLISEISVPCCPDLRQWVAILSRDIRISSCLRELNRALCLHSACMRLLEYESSSTFLVFNTPALIESCFLNQQASDQ